MSASIVRTAVAALLALALPLVSAYAAAQPERAEGAHHNWRQMHASELIGKQVTNREGEELGEVKDLMLDLRTGGVRYAIVEFSPAAGLDEKLFAYPVRSFGPARAADKLVLNVDRHQLEQAEGFDRDRFPPGDDPYWGRIEQPDATAAAGAGPAGLPAEAIAPPRFVRASRVIGQDVKDRGGMPAGEVKDVVLDLGTGEIRHAVIERDGRTLGVPINQLSAEGEELILKLP
jgi:sporulation protein YlmC with PRC-barrel domain